MAEVRDCLYQEQVQRVGAAYSALLAKVKAKAPAAATELVASQRSWKDFVSHSCDFYAAFNAASSVPDDSRVNCWAEFSSARVKVLKAWESDLQRRSAAGSIGGR